VKGEYRHNPTPVISHNNQSPQKKRSKK